MSVTEKANLIIYRVREKGLEVFLINSENKWQIPQSNTQNAKLTADLAAHDNLIELDAVHREDGIVEKAVAVEGDWHDIPSLKGLIKEDVLFVKDTIKQMVPDVMEKGTYFAVKEAFRKVMPTQYAFLKELKDIITERNSTTNL